MPDLGSLQGSISDESEEGESEEESGSEVTSGDDEDLITVPKEYLDGLEKQAQVCVRLDCPVLEFDVASGDDEALITVPKEHLSQMSVTLPGHHQINHECEMRYVILSLD